MNTKTHLTFLRHAHTEHNGPPKRFQGRLDVPLSKRGIEQCRAAKQQFDWVDNVIASPAIRVQQTLHYIFEGSNKQPNVIYNDDLWEIDNGWYSGKLQSEVQQIDPAGYNAWIKEPGNTRPGGGESLNEMLDRASSAIEEAYLRPGISDGTLFATHGGIIRVLLLKANNNSMKKFHDLEVDNLGTYHIPKKKIAHS